MSETPSANPAAGDAASLQAEPQRARPLQIGFQPDTIADGLFGFFGSPVRAHIALTVALVVLFAFYFFVHLFRDVDESPWRDAIQPSPVGYLEFKYDDDVLLRFFSPKKVDDIKKRLGDEITHERETAFEYRKRVINSAAQFIQTYEQSKINPPVIFRLAGPAANRGDVTPATDRDYELTNLETLIGWLRNARIDMASEDLTRYQAELDSLIALDSAEQKIIADARARIAGLDYEFNFLWLYHEKSGWVFELVFWAIIGVLVNTLIALISLSRLKFSADLSAASSAAPSTNRYNAAEFLLFVPKVVLAPIVGLIVLALIVTGITETQITLSNLPMFLVFAFIAGFASERFTGLIRTAVNHLIPKFEVSPDKIQETYGEDVRQRAINRQLYFPRTITALRDDLKAAVTEEAEIRINEIGVRRNIVGS